MTHPSEGAADAPRGRGGETTRRGLLGRAAIAVGAGAAAAAGLAALRPWDAGRDARADEEVEVPEGPPLARRRFGKSGVEVSLIGLGGSHIGRVERKEAVAIIRLAVERGVTFLDNAADYEDGRSEEVMGEALALGGLRAKAFLMTKCCAHGAWTRAQAERSLEASLRRLRTDVLDLYQLHALGPGDPAKVLAKGGALEALEAARKAGKVRHVGFTGHADPDVFLEMLASGYPFAAAQMPVNPADASYKSFTRRVLPVLAERGIAAIGMKALGDNRIAKSGAATAEECRRYALSQPIATLVCGIQSRRDLAQDLAIARGFTPMSEAERAALEARLAKRSPAGELEWYKA
jgi:aryl-alcohol dehydrogenase-like predicted oxidoreductase